MRVLLVSFHPSQINICTCGGCTLCLLHSGLRAFGHVAMANGGVPQLSKWLRMCGCLPRIGALPCWWHRATMWHCGCRPQCWHQRGQVADIVCLLACCAGPFGHFWYQGLEKFVASRFTHGSFKFIATKVRWVRVGLQYGRPGILCHTSTHTCASLRLHVCSVGAAHSPFQSAGKVIDALGRWHAGWSSR